MVIHNCFVPQVFRTDWTNKSRKTPHLERATALLCCLPLQSRSHAILCPRSTAHSTEIHLSSSPPELTPPSPYSRIPTLAHCYVQSSRYVRFLPIIVARHTGLTLHGCRWSHLYHTSSHTSQEVFKRYASVVRWLSEEQEVCFPFNRDLFFL